MRRKICVTIPNLQGAGCERMLSEVLPHYAEAFDVDLVLAEKVISYKIPDTVNIIILETPLASGGLKLKVINSLKLIFRLRRLIKANHYDVIVSYLDIYNVMVFLANSFSRKIPHIACEQTLDPEFFKHGTMASWKKTITKTIVGFTYNRVDQVIAISENVKNLLTNDFGVTAPIVAIHNGIDVTRFNLNKPDDLSLIDTDFLNAKIKLLCISRLDYQKNITFLLDAFAKTVRQIPEAKLFILGTGQEKLDIENRITELKLSEKVYLLGFRTNPEDYLKLCDVFVLASRYESLGNVIIEALACGVPFVTTNYGEVLKELIVLDGLGKIIEQGETEKFADAIIDTLNSKKSLNPLILSDYAINNFEVSKKADEYVAIVESILK